MSTSQGRHVSSVRGRKGVTPGTTPLLRARLARPLTTTTVNTNHLHQAGLLSLLFSCSVLTLLRLPKGSLRERYYEYYSQQ
jgi:hypothetical protein